MTHDGAYIEIWVAPSIAFRDRARILLSDKSPGKTEPRTRLRPYGSLSLPHNTGISGIKNKGKGIGMRDMKMCVVIFSYPKNLKWDSNK
jgi:hypothetical protein